MLCKTSGSWIKYAFTGARVVFISEEAMQARGSKSTLMILLWIRSTAGQALLLSITGRRLYLTVRIMTLDLGEGSHVLTIVGTTGSQNYKFPIFRQTRLRNILIQLPHYFGGRPG